MTRLHRMRRLARYNILTPFAALAAMAVAGPAHSATIVVDAPDNDGVELTAVDDALINNSDITNPGFVVVWGNDPVDFIVNNSGATITGDGNSAVWIDNDIGSFTNHGIVTTDTDAAVGASGLIQTFINTGTIINTDPSMASAVFTGGGFGTFTNSGTIEGAGTGVATFGNVGAFTNSGTIAGGAGSGVYVGGTTGDFSNSGTISSVDSTAAEFNDDVTSFLNSGTMTSASGWTSIFFNEDVTAFTNSGDITNTGTGKGVEFNMDQGPVGSFLNTGTITAGAGEVAIGFYGSGAAGVGTFDNTGTITADGHAAIGANGHFGTFTNSGTISGAEGDAMFLGMGVTSFTNEVGGVIVNTDALGSWGNGVAFNTSLANGGAVGSFTNHGTISAAANSADGSGVGFFGSAPTHVTGSFLNTGTITGVGNGVYSNGGFGTFTNSGTISTTEYSAVNSEGGITTFDNSGTISSVNGRGVSIDGAVATFVNSGTITGFENGVTFGDGVTNGSNSGNIVSTAAAGEIGVRIDGMGSFNNSGLIEGATGVVFNVDPGEAGFLTNSGVIRGTGGTAIYFAGGENNGGSDPAGDDRLTILTGSKIFGDIGFGDGNDTFNFADFRGNTLLEVYGLEDVEAGSTNYVWDQPNDQIAIFDLTSTASVGSSMSQVVNSVNGIASGHLDGLLFGGLGEELILNYAPAAPMGAAETATEEAVLSDIDIGNAGTGTKAWASVFGGGSGDADPVELSNIYGGIVAGAHTQLTEGTRVGVLAGYVRGHTDVMAGQQTLVTDTGLLGVYGRSEFGIADLDFSLLGGYSGHRSEREIVALGGTETATANFSSWFISPSLGVEVPVLVNEKGEVSLTASASYVGGRVAAYDESGSSMDLSVAAQTIGVLDARIGIKGETAISANEHGNVRLLGNAGVFGQSNFGSSSVAVSVLGQTVDAVMPNSSGYGVFAGIGIEARVGHNVTISGGLDASLRNDGVAAAAAKAGIGASF